MSFLNLNPPSQQRPVHGGFPDAPRRIQVRKVQTGKLPVITIHDYPSPHVVPVAVGGRCPNCGTWHR